MKATNVLSQYEIPMLIVFHISHSQSLTVG